LRLVARNEQRQWQVSPIVEIAMSAGDDVEAKLRKARSKVTR
jgi:hypothetical protein